MVLVSLCQRCSSQRESTWNVHQAEFHVGRMVHWKVQLCVDCTTHVEQALLSALKPSADAAKGAATK